MELLASSYGALSGAKVAGLAALVAFGARNRLRILPRLSGGEANGGEALRRSVLGETLVMVVVLIVAGFLAYTPPPGG
jgi:putative copper export protein